MQLAMTVTLAVLIVLAVVGVLGYAIDRGVARREKSGGLRNGT